jgi:hypothetical protein
VWPWQNAYCRDFDRCIDAEWANAVVSFNWQLSWPDESIPWHAVGLTDHSSLMEPGPIEFEQAPDDIEQCSACKGFGAVIRLDWETGPVYEDCKRCEATGVDPSLCPA